MTAPAQVGPSFSSGGPTPFQELDEYLADIGDRIRAERQARGWSQGWLADRAELSLNTLKRLEGGTGTLRVMAQACRALGVPMAHLLSDQWQMPDSGPSLTPLQVQVLREAASGDPAEVVGVVLGLSATQVSHQLRGVYERFGVKGLSPKDMRGAAVRIARFHGLIDA